MLIISLTRVFFHARFGATSGAKAATRGAVPYRAVPRRAVPDPVGKNLYALSL